jgi:Domain of unknown function (DUF4259)
MGAWGYGSFENDSALDFVSELINQKALKKLVLKKKITDWDYDEIRVSAEILIHLHSLNEFWVDQEIIDGLIRGLELAIADKDWHAAWVDERDAKAIVKQLKKFVRQLKNIEGY